MSVQLHDLHWLAGLLEGEGCFRLVANRTNGPKIYPQIMFVSTDKDIADRAASLLNPPTIHIWKPKPYKNCFSKKNQYRFVLCGKQAAGWMMTLYSLMGERRKSKISECLLAWRGNVEKVLL